jgi:glycolate oxidase
VTEVTVKLTPIPELARVVMAGFDSVRDCANAVADIIEAGIIPAGLEMMDSFAIEAAEGFANVGYPLDAQALLLCELDGTKAQVQAELESVLKVLSGASSISATAFAQSRTESNPAITTRANSGIGVSFTVTSVTIPSKPSEPFINAKNPNPSS